MVGVVGIEPTTFCSQSRRAEPLRYTPQSMTIPYNTPKIEIVKAEITES